MVKANVGGVDRLLRIVAGIGLLGWAVMDGPMWALIGIVPLATGILRFCPFYPLLGVSTCKTTGNEY